MRCPLLFAFSLVLVAAGSPALAAEADTKFLLAGVSEIGFPGIPGPLCVFGPEAFPVLGVSSKSGTDPVVAAGRLGKGRVVGFGHEGYFSADSLKVAGTNTLVVNALKWAGRAEKIAAGPKVGVRGLPQVGKALDGLKVTEIGGANWTAKLNEFGVVIVNPGGVTKPEADALRKYVEAGGGLVSGVPGWGWSQVHPGKTLAADFPMNQVFAAAGLAFINGYLERPKDGILPAKEPPSALTHTASALDALDRWTSGGPALSAADADLVRGAITRLNAGVPALAAEPLRKRLAKSLDAAGARIPVPTPQKPVGPKDPSGKLMLAIYTQQAMQLPPEQTKPHPAASTFPGLVPADAPRVTRKVTVGLGTPGYKCDGYGAGAGARLWQSTGLYAAPGEVVKVTVLAGAPKTLGVQIGSHSDTLWHLQSWQRSPDVVRRFDLRTGDNAAANPFGGLVYITFPHDSPRGSVEVTIAGAVEAPLFVLGKTTAAEWDAIRKRPAPWAEFASGKLMITVPSDAARKVADPAELMKFWDDVLDRCAELSAVSKDRGRAERFVHDVQISAGYMHSGYPIMAPMGEIPTVLDVAKMKRQGAWGYFHELGHNHQSHQWTFDGTVEVTCNLYSMYVTETLCPKALLHEAIRPDAIARHATKYKAGGTKFDAWKQDPFLALIVYKQLRDEFGWAAYQKAFADYLKAPAADRPRNDADRRDQWLVRMSNATGKNLTAAFDYWGIPVTQAARDRVAKLPQWIPPDPTRR